MVSTPPPISSAPPRCWIRFPACLGVFISGRMHGDMRNCLLLVSLITLSALTGCASSGATADDPYAVDPTVECVRIRSVRNWSAIDDEHLWLEVSGSRQYLVSLWARCPGIRFAQVIALSNASSRICPNDFGSVLFDDGGTTMRCGIGNVELVGSRGEAEAIVDDRRTHDE